MAVVICEKWFSNQRLRKISKILPQSLGRLCFLTGFTSQAIIGIIADVNADVAQW